jgi:hypothetical protein
MDYKSLRYIEVMGGAPEAFVSLGSGSFGWFTFGDGG